MIDDPCYFVPWGKGAQVLLLAVFTATDFRTFLRFF